MWEPTLKNKPFAPSSDTISTVVKVWVPTLITLLRAEVESAARGRQH
jgi:hypothetical protein